MIEFSVCWNRDGFASAIDAIDAAIDARKWFSWVTEYIVFTDYYIWL